MAGTKVSVLTAGAALGGTEAIPAVQSAATVKITADQIKTFVSASPTLVTPVLGVAAGTSLALGGATIGTDLIGAGVSKFRVDSGGAVYTPAGTSGGFYFSTGNSGVYNRTSTAVTLYSGANVAEFSSTAAQIISTAALSFSSGAIGAASDTGLSRISAGVIGVGTGAQGSAAGSLNLLTLVMTGNLQMQNNNSSFYLGAAYDLIFGRGGPATFQHGFADTASPVAQTIKFQDVVAGTSNTAGVNATIQAPAGTGTGAGGSLIFQVAPAGSSGSAKNAWATALTIDSTKLATFAGNIDLSTGNPTISRAGTTAFQLQAGRIFTAVELSIASGINISFSNGADYNRALVNSAGGGIALTNGSTGGQSLEMREMTAPAAPATNGVYFYAEDNGAGKTRLMALFATGAAQQVAIEP